LANVCLSCPDEVRSLYLGILSEKAYDNDAVDGGSSSGSRKRKNVETIQKEIHDYFESKDLPIKKIESINRALIRAFICSGISFNVINNPFFREFLYELRPNYNPPSRQILSGQLLSIEIAKVNDFMNSELNFAENLTIGKYI
jgi:hypothetical protein